MIASRLVIPFEEYGNEALCARQWPVDDNIAFVRGRISIDKQAGGMRIDPAHSMCRAAPKMIQHPVSGVERRGMIRLV
jgi:hypothetical protein